MTEKPIPKETETEGELADVDITSGPEAEKNESEKKVPKEDKKPPSGKKNAKDKAKARILELEERVMRQMAEFENFRKRTEKEKAKMFAMGAGSVIEKMLPIVDNFERGLSVIPEAEANSSFAEGMQMIYKQFLAELEGMGVALIPAVGHEFDPELHNAVMQVESEEYESGIIAQEMQKGYTYQDTVIRYSMVAVAI